MLIDVIILAGGTVDDELLRADGGVTCKSLIPLGGRVLLEYVLHALRTSRHVGRIVVVGPEMLASHPVAAGADMLLIEGSTRAENLYRGIDALPDAQRLLMVTSDTPLLTGAMIDELVTAAPDCDICYPIVAHETALTAFDKRKWVFVPLRDGTFTGSSMVLFKPAAFRQVRPLIEQVFGAHRDHWRAARLFGLGFLLRCRLGWITLPAIEAHISRQLNLDCRSYPARHAEMAFDIDHPSDLSLARSLFEQRLV